MNLTGKWGNPKSVISDMDTFDGVSVHVFEDSGTAYDMAMCSDEVQPGDILYVPDDKQWNPVTEQFESIGAVIGVADTWPMAVTDNHGSFHTIAEGYTIETVPDIDSRVVNGYKTAQKFVDMLHMVESSRGQVSIIDFLD